MSRIESGPQSGRPPQRPLPVGCPANKYANQVPLEDLQFGIIVRGPLTQAGGLPAPQPRIIGTGIFTPVPLGQIMAHLPFESYPEAYIAAITATDPTVLSDSLLKSPDDPLVATLKGVIGIAEIADNAVAFAESSTNPIVAAIGRQLTGHVAVCPRKIVTPSLHRDLSVTDEERCWALQNSHFVSILEIIARGEPLGERDPRL